MHICSYIQYSLSVCVCWVKLDPSCCWTPIPSWFLTFSFSANWHTGTQRVFGLLVCCCWWEVWVSAPGFLLLFLQPQESSGWYYLAYIVRVGFNRQVDDKLSKEEAMIVWWVLVRTNWRGERRRRVSRLIEKDQAFGADIKTPSPAFPGRPLKPKPIPHALPSLVRGKSTTQQGQGEAGARGGGGAGWRWLTNPTIIYMHTTTTTNQSPSPQEPTFVTSHQQKQQSVSLPAAGLLPFLLRQL